MTAISGDTRPPLKPAPLRVKRVKVSEEALREALMETLSTCAGVRYGLVGKNGVGKSTLMQAIGHIGLADFPKHLRILYVDQLEAVDDSQSVLSLVLGADKQALVYKSHAELLEAATGEGDAEACARAVQQVCAVLRVRVAEGGLDADERV